jgi:uncharacterized protein (DUF58 family)
MNSAPESGSPRAPATAALGAALVATGFGFGLDAALVCGLGLLGLAGGAVAWVELATRGGRLERERGPRRLDERDSYPLSLGLRGTAVPPPGGELRDPLLERPVVVGPTWGRSLSKSVWFDGPGRRRLDPARIVVRDPLGLWERELASDRGEEVVVLPRVDPIHWPEGGSEDEGGRSGGSGTASEASSRRGGLAQFEVDGLRPYRDGSPASRIHWPAVARTGEMLERRLIAGGDPRPLVVFDPRGEDVWVRVRAMRAAASLCVALARSGGCNLLLPGARRVLPIDSALHAWPEAHTKLAMADEHGAATLPSQTTGALVYWVTAGRALPRSARRLHPRSLLITPNGSRRSAVFRVSGCFAYPAASYARGGSRARVAA